jgi:CheY-like chemotaxis protein
MKIIVVDDEQDVQILYRQQFRKEIRQDQIRLCFAFSAEEALERLQDKGADCLVLADINMPGMNGLEMLRVIKTRYPDLKVFMVTAYGDEQNYQKAIEYGADDYIRKPVQFERLKEKIWSLQSQMS